MNPLAEALVEGVTILEEEGGASITWNGQDYPCAGGPVMGGKVLDLGGYKLNASTSVVVRTSIFEVRPLEKQTLVYTAAAGATGKRLRIKSITPIYDDLLVLECEEPNQGA